MPSGERKDDGVCAHADTAHGQEARATGGETAALLGGGPAAMVISLTVHRLFQVAAFAAVGGCRRVSARRPDLKHYLPFIDIGN